MRSDGRDPSTAALDDLPLEAYRTLKDIAERRAIRDNVFKLDAHGTVVIVGWARHNRVSSWSNCDADYLLGMEYKDASYKYSGVVHTWSVDEVRRHVRKDQR